MHCILAMPILFSQALKMVTLPELVGAPLRSALRSEISRVLPEVLVLRHALHERPALTWNEAQTSRTLVERLRSIEGVSLVETAMARFGIVGLIKGERPGPVVALRADMDALPIEETSGAPWRSKHAGVMHACGHDG